MSKDQIKEAVLTELTRLENQWENNTELGEDLFYQGMLSGMARALDIIIDMPEDKSANTKR